jgi:hypothetical protein
VTVQITSSGPGHEAVALFDRPVEDRDGEAFALHVEHQVFAHDGETHETDIRFFTHDILPAFEVEKSTMYTLLL